MIRKIMILHITKMIIFVVSLTTSIALQYIQQMLRCKLAADWSITNESSYGPKGN